MEVAFVKAVYPYREHRGIIIIHLYNDRYIEVMDINKWDEMMRALAKPQQPVKRKVAALAPPPKQWRWND